MTLCLQFYTMQLKLTLGNIFFFKKKQQAGVSLSAAVKIYDETGSHKNHPRKRRAAVSPAAEDQLPKAQQLPVPWVRAHLSAFCSSIRRHITRSGHVGMLQRN